jgi:hypothetical protein
MRGWAGAECRPMSIDRLQPRRAADRVPNWKAPPYRDLQMQIGEGLKAHYEPPKELPSRLLVLILQMNDGWEEK